MSTGGVISRRGSQRRKLQRQGSRASQNSFDDDLKKCRDYFRQIDVNGDGKLSADEFAKMLEDIGMDLDVKGLQRAYNTADHDGDGVISFKEFVDAYSCQLTVSKGCTNVNKSSDCSTNLPNTIQRKQSISDMAMKKCREYFREMDVNGDGKLSSDEFLKMVEHIGVGIDVSQLTKAYHKADCNGDGEISFKEFMDAYSGVVAVNSCESNNRAQRKLSRSNSTSSRRRISNQSNIAPVSENDRVEFCKYFWCSDKDGDGKLSLSEFSDMLLRLGMKLNNRDLHKAFRVADENRDGFVSFNDFVTTYLNQITSDMLSRDKIKQIYWTSDRHNKGYLLKGECCEAMRLLGNDLDEKQLDILMRVMDKNHDGKISLDEFLVFLG